VVAAPTPVAVVVVSPAAARAASARGAAGLLVPGAGPNVCRDTAVASLVRGRVRNSVLGGAVGGRPLIVLGRGPAAITIYVSLPPPGCRHNVNRYPVAIVGPGYRGLLRSSATRLPGVVGIADLAPTAVALEHGRPPIVTATRSEMPLDELRRLDARLSAAHDVRPAADVMLVALVLLTSALALFRSSAAAGRAAVFAGAAALTAALALSALGPTEPVRLAVGFGVTLAVLGTVAGLVTTPPRRLVAVVAGFLGLFALALAVWPEVSALAVIGPHPDGGVRFYGVTNQVETLLLAPVLVAADLLPARWAAPLALLALFTIGASWTGADGGGVVVFALAFLVLALRRSAVALSWRRVVVAAAGALAVALLAVGADVAAGGTSHVTRAVRGGPEALLDDLLGRLQVSAASATNSWVAAEAVGVGLVTLFALMRLPSRPRTLDAMLAALACSLLVNDSPVAIAMYGALGAVAVVAYERGRVQASVRPANGHFPG
jgi:hypothetical protein